jgi:hypothetical protein
LRSDSRGAATLIIIFLALLCASGCSSRAPISRDVTARLLLATLTDRCDRQTVTVRAGRAGTVRARQAVAWFDKTVLSDPAFARSAESSNSDERHGRLTYSDDGRKLWVDWNEFTPPEAVERERLELRTCIYVPDRVDLIDRSFDGDGRSGRIMFRESLRLSAFGERMSKTALFDADIVAAGKPQDYEYLAELKKTPSGDWSVRSVELH